MPSSFSTPSKVWAIMLAPFLVATVAMGSYQYTHGLFVEPLVQAFGWSRTEVSASLSFAAVGIITGPFLGRLLDIFLCIWGRILARFVPSCTHFVSLRAPFCLHFGHFRLPLA